MQTIEEVRRRIGEWGGVVWAFATLRAAFEAGALECLNEPRTSAEVSERTGLPPHIIAPLLDVLVGAEFVEAREGKYVASAGLLAILRSPLRDVVLADLRSTALQSEVMVTGARARTLGAGWTHTDPEVLQAQGFSTAPIIQMLAQTVFPRLSGLEERLRAPGATFLDVGSGVGAVAILLCRLYPEVRVVGLEPQPIPRDLSMKNLAAAGVAGRVEIRAQRVEEFTDTEEFDLIWLPQVFLPEEIVRQALGTTRRALRPGGWLLMVTISVPGADLRAAVSRLTNTLVGGDTLFPEQVAAMTTDAGYEAVHILPGPPWTPLHFIAARRPA